MSVGLSTTMQIILALDALVLYWALRRWKSVRAAILVLASYLFYANWNPVFLLIVIAVSLLDYFVGRRLSREERSGMRGVLLAISVIVNLGLLVAMRYFGALTALNKLLLTALGMKAPELSAAPPIGVFLFLLQSLGYSLDVYRRRSAPISSLLDYLVFIAFFPRLFAGPLLRADEFLPRWSERPTLPPERRGLLLFLLASGVVKKVVFADYLALNLVDKVFDLPQLFSTTEVILALYGYTLQLYCQLSAYTDFALAAGLLVGLELPLNFRFPLQASNLRAFWRRWLITLSSWVRDHVYVSLGGSRARWTWLVYVNLLVTMLLVGVANGLAWTFVLWGLLHGLALVLTRGYQRLRHREDLAQPTAWWKRPIGVFFTFNFVVITWAIFRAGSFETVNLLVTILKAQIWGAPNLSLPVVLVLALGVIGAWSPPRWYDRLRRLFTGLPLPIQAALVIVVLLAVFKVSAAGAIPFVYERF